MRHDRKVQGCQELVVFLLSLVLVRRVYLERSFVALRNSANEDRNRDRCK